MKRRYKSIIDKGNMGDVKISCVNSGFRNGWSLVFNVRGNRKCSGRWVDVWQAKCNRGSILM
jgi:hypothetical protein